jgi:hypothetical protein
VPGRTVGELDRELLENAPMLAEDVARAGEVFAAIFYGRQPADAAAARTVAEVAQGIDRARARA